MADSTQGNGAPEASQGTAGSPNADDVNQLVNRAITARLGAFEKTFGGKLEKSLADFSTALSSKFEETFSKAAPPPQQSAPQSQGEPQKPPSVTESPEFRSLQKQLADLQKRAEAAEAAKVAEQAKSRDVAMRQRVASALAEAGIDPRYAKHALGHLVDAEKRVRFGEDGESLVFRDSDGGDLEFTAGLKSWATSDEAKIYLPARGTAGSGDRSSQSAGRGQAPPDPRETLAQLLIQRNSGA